MESNDNDMKHVDAFLGLVREVIEIGSPRKGQKVGYHVEDMKKTLGYLESTMLRSWGEMDRSEAAGVLLKLQSIATSATRAAGEVLEATGMELSTSTRIPGSG